MLRNIFSVIIVIDTFSENGYKHGCVSLPTCQVVQMFTLYYNKSSKDVAENIFMRAGC